MSLKYCFKKNIAGGMKLYLLGIVLKNTNNSLHLYTVLGTAHGLPPGCLAHPARTAGDTHVHPLAEPLKKPFQFCQCLYLLYTSHGVYRLTFILEKSLVLEIL